MNRAGPVGAALDCRRPFERDVLIKHTCVVPIYCLYRKEKYLPPPTLHAFAWSGEWRLSSAERQSRRRSDTYCLDRLLRSWCG